MRIVLAIFLAGCSLPLSVRPSALQRVEPPVIASRPCLPSPVPDRVMLGEVEDPTPVRILNGIEVRSFTFSRESIDKFQAYLQRLEEIAKRARTCLAP